MRDTPLANRSRFARVSAVLPVLLITGGAVLIGCPGTLQDKECFLQERDAVKILAASCLNPGCHNAEDKIFGLDLESPGIGARLSGAISANCNGNALIVPGDPEASLVYTKLTDPTPCGSRMPLGQSELYPEDIEILRVWIAGLDGSCADADGASGGGAGEGM